MEDGCLAWCAIAELNKMLQVDISGCERVYDLRKAIADASRKKIPLLRAEIWKVREPDDWPANNQSSSRLIPPGDEDLRKAADLLLPHYLLTTVLERPITKHGIEFILHIRDWRDHFPSVPVALKERYIWCGISGQNRIFQVEISNCKSIGDLKQAIEHDSKVDARDIWKIKSPRDSPAQFSLNDDIRTEDFPTAKSRLLALAEPLGSDAPWDPSQMFDDATLKENVCFIVTTSTTEIVSTSESSSVRKYQAEKRLIWCAIAGRKRLFQIDIKGCERVEDMYPKLKRNSGLSEPKRKTLLIRDPQMWPISDGTPAPEIPVEKERLLEIAKPVSPLALVETEFGKEAEADENHLQLVIILYDDYIPSESYAPKQFVWCGIAGSNAVCRLEIDHYVIASIVAGDILMLGEYRMRFDEVNIWKVKEPQMWRIEDIVTNVKPIPDEEEALNKIADPFTNDFIPDANLLKNLSEECIFLIAQISDNLCAESSSSVESASSVQSEKNPLVDREDIQATLKYLGFRYKEIFQDVNRWHVGDIFTPEGNRYVVKYLRPGREDEVDILKYLLRFRRTPQNHTPPEAKFPHIEKGALMITPYLGVPVRRYEHLSRDLLSIVQQLLEGVAFLHSKRVAHMDLKASHVLVDESARLWIVDYDLSEILEDGEEIVSGYRGTKGCTAPEVGRKAYNPLLADVWAAGKIVDELCGLCADHKDRDFLLSLGGKLMNKEPLKRLLIQEALKQIIEYKVCFDMPVCNLVT